MTGIVFGVKGTLDGERTDMTGGGEYRFAAAMLKMKVQRSLPAFYSLVTRCCAMLLRPAKSR